MNLIHVSFNFVSSPSGSFLVRSLSNWCGVGYRASQDTTKPVDGSGCCRTGAYGGCLWTLMWREQICVECWLMVRKTMANYSFFFASCSCNWWVHWALEAHRDSNSVCWWCIRSCSFSTLHSVHSQGLRLRCHMIGAMLVLTTQTQWRNCCLQPT